MDKKDIIKYFEDNQDVAATFMDDWAYNTEELDSAGVVYNIKDNYGGADCGSTYYTVWEFNAGGEVFYLRFDGWYASHYGVDYQDFKEVFPKEVTKVEYQ